MTNGVGVWPQTAYLCSTMTPQCLKADAILLYALVGVPGFLTFTPEDGNKSSSSSNLTRAKTSPLAVLSCFMGHHMS
eukprot:4650280-Amphidinium_carterae.1